MHIDIKPYTVAEMARLYGISKLTFNKWIKPHLAAIGNRIGHYFTSLQVKIIFEKLGPPHDEANDG